MIARSVGLLGVGLVVALASGCAAASDSVSSEDELQGGAVDRADPAVGLIWFEDNLCTGTLISPTVVLTAGHCVQEHIEGFYTGTGKATSTLGPNTVKGMVRHEVAEMAPFPGYKKPVNSIPFDPSKVNCPNPTLDIGLVRLAKPITNIKPVKLTSGVLPTVGATCTGIGFGRHDEGGVETFAKKRRGTEIVAEVTAVDIRVTQGTALADSGDSGGPLLCGGLIVGATSCHADGAYPQHATEYYARVDSASSWIEKKLGEWR